MRKCPVNMTGHPNSYADSFGSLTFSFDGRASMGPESGDDLYCAPRANEMSLKHLTDLSDFFTNLCVIRDPEGLRQQLSQDAKEQAELEGPEAGFIVERTVAERAFANWPYSRITRWAAENGLAVDFTGSRTLILSVSVNSS